MIKLTYILVLMLTGCVFGIDRPLDKQIKARDLIDLGVMQLEQGHAEQAMATYEMAFEVYPIPEALDGIGCVYLYNGDIKLAEHFFNLALELDPDYSVAMGHLAIIAELKGDSTLAYNLYRESLLGDPEEVRIRNNFSAFLFDRYKTSGIGLAEARQEILRTNSLTNSDLIRDNYLIVEGEYEQQK